MVREEKPVLEVYWKANRARRKAKEIEERNQTDTRKTNEGKYTGITRVRTGVVDADRQKVCFLAFPENPWCSSSYEHQVGKPKQYTEEYLIT